MSNGLSSTYSDYQQASCQWLDSIPQHWIECRIKQIVSTPVTDGPHETPKFEDDGVPFLSAESVKNLKLDFARKRGYISAELHRQYSKKYIPRRGDIYMVKSGATTGALAIVETDDEFNIWSPLAAIRCRKDICFDRFVFYTMQSEFFQRSIELSWSFGTQQNIGMGVIENLFIARPPLPEQKQVAAFLDYETAKIDALIEKQQQLIALLGEKRQAVISHAVTKGLNPDAPMRDSGIEWLGEVPEHWDVRAISKCITKITNGYVGPTRDILVEEGVPYIQATHIKNGVVNFDNAYFVRQEWSDKKSKSILAAGDVLIVQTGAGTGDVGLVSESEEGFNCHALIILTSAAKSMTGSYLALALQSEYGKAVLFSIRTGGMHPHLNCGEVKFVRVPVPPLSEQADISKHVKEATETFDILEAKALDAVELLQERRTALISAAVTGKIDVRGWKPPSSGAKQETEMEVA